MKNLENKISELKKFVEKNFEIFSGLCFTLSLIRSDFANAEVEVKLSVPTEYRTNEENILSSLEEIKDLIAFQIEN